MIVKNGLVHPHRLRVIRVASACLIALFSAAQAEEPNGRHVQIAVVIDASPEPLIAESICEKEVECVVISRPDVGIKVSVVLRQRDDLQANRSTVDCASPCSFPWALERSISAGTKPSISSTANPAWAGIIFFSGRTPR